MLMGEKIKSLVRSKILNNNFEIELNHPLRKHGDMQIHIQSKKLRYEIRLKDYIKMAIGVSFSGEQLERMKNIKNE